MLSDYYKPLLKRAVTKVSDGGGGFTVTTSDALFWGYIAELSGREILRNQQIGNDATCELFTETVLKLTDRVVDVHNEEVAATLGGVSTSFLGLFPITDTLVPIAGRDYVLPADFPASADYAVVGTAEVAGVDVGFTKLKSIGSVRITPNVDLATLNIAVIAKSSGVGALVVVDGTPISVSTEYEVVWKYSNFHLRYLLKQVR